jgi:hypothetical protein
LPAGGLIIDEGLQEETLVMRGGMRARFARLGDALASSQNALLRLSMLGGEIALAAVTVVDITMSTGLASASVEERDYARAGMVAHPVESASSTASSAGSVGNSVELQRVINMIRRKSRQAAAT